MKIASRRIGLGHNPYIVAEIGASHNGDLNKAIELIWTAKVAGASACKIQVYDPAALAIKRGGSLDAVIDFGPWAGQTYWDVYSKAYTPLGWVPELFHKAKEYGITLFSSVFDSEGIDFLYAGGCPAYKISSYELGDKDLISKAAKTGRPVILSTGNRSIQEIALACVEVVASTADLAVLHCVSKYPCEDDEAQTDRIGELRKNYVTVGFSDHTLGTQAAINAIDRGAVIIEKHIKLDGDTTSADSAFAIEPEAFRDYVKAVNQAYEARLFACAV